MTVMPFGKHKGKAIENLPSSYLKWMAENFDEKDPTRRVLCLEADKEYQHREQHNCHFEDPPSNQIKKRVTCPNCQHQFEIDR